MFEDEKKFENTQGTETPAAGTTPTPETANPTAGQSAGACDPYAYQNGYYRNTAPHQDEPVNSGAYSQPQTASSGSGSQVPPTSQSGYSYVNYYSDPNSGNHQKPKKKHTGLKAVACVLAMVLVSGASIGIYEGVRSSMETSSAVVSDSSEDTAEKSDSSASDDSSTGSVQSSNAESWIQLASKEGSMSIADIVKKVTPSVVGVQSTFTSTANNSAYNYYGGFFGFGGNNGQNGTQQAVGVGTGIIMSEDGYIVTNAHVIYDDENGYGEATAVQIQMSDEKTTYDAKIVAYDKEADIAVLKIDAKGLTAAEFGDSDKCEVGEAVVAIGNPLGLEFQNTVTCGIISALNRKVTINDNAMTLIQTDAAINNGNSGGPLINSSGQVIGINSAKMSSTYSSSGASVEGLGFAIPMTEAKQIVDDLINYGYVTGRPQLGITCQDVSQAVSEAYNIPVGAYIISVTEGGAAEKAGLQAADVITGIQDQDISTTEELNNIKNEYNAGDTVTLKVVRNGQEMKVDVVLEEVKGTQNQTKQKSSNSNSENSNGENSNSENSNG